MVVTLMDAYTRHQIYLEGYKDAAETDIPPLLLAIDAELKRRLSQLTVENLNQMSRKQLRKFIASLAKRVKSTSDEFLLNMLDKLRKLAEEDTQLNLRIIEAANGTTIADATHAGLFGVLALSGTIEGRARLWAKIKSTPDPASGQTIRQLFTRYLRNVSDAVKQFILRAYANGWSVKETIQAIFRNKSNVGLIGVSGRLITQGISAVRTVIQHVTSLTQAAVNSIFYDTYEWVSVLDKGTTKICRFRDGKRYLFGVGPLPPAHFRCRSKILPIPRNAEANSIPGSLYDWVITQPIVVQNDILGAPVAAAIRNGSLASGRLGRFRARKGLTLEQFLNKFRFIVAT